MAEILSSSARKRMLLLVRSICLLTGVSFIAVTMGCGNTDNTGSAAKDDGASYKKITLNLGTSSSSAGDAQGAQLVDYKVEFVGLGVWRNGALESSSNLTGGTAEIYVPVTEIELRATLVSYDSSAPDQVFTSRFSKSVVVKPDTEELSLEFLNYSRAEMVNVLGLLYADKEKPAAGAGLSVVDNFSGAVITLPGQAQLVTADERGVYSFRYFYGEGPIRLRTNPLLGNREFELRPSALPDAGWQALPYLNLAGTDQTSPFQINLALLKGDKGDRGDKGDKGDRGDMGPSSRLLQENLAMGSTECPMGGVRLSSWNQAPGTSSSTFDPAKGSQELIVRVICNGLRGPDGAAGSSGSGGVTLYQGATAIGDFIGGAIPYLALDGAFFNLSDGLFPGTLRASIGSMSKFASRDCSGSPFVDDGRGRAARGMSAYTVASTVGGVSQALPVLSQVANDNWETGTVKCDAVSSVASSGVFALGTAFASGPFGGARTTDGTSWSRASLPNSISNPESYLAATNSAGVTLLVPKYGWSGNQPILRTSDNGLTYSELVLSSGSGDRYLWAVGTKFYVSAVNGLYRSLDNGGSWTLLPYWIGTPRAGNSRLYSYLYEGGRSWFDANLDSSVSRSVPSGCTSPWKTMGFLRCVLSSSLFETVSGSTVLWRPVSSNGNAQVPSKSSDAPVSASTNGTVVVYKTSSSSSSFALSTDGGLTWRSESAQSSIEDIQVSPNGAYLVGRFGGTLQVVSTPAGSDPLGTWSVLYQPDSGQGRNSVSSNAMFLSDGRLLFGAGSQLWTWDSVTAPAAASLAADWSSNEVRYVSSIFDCGVGKVCLAGNGSSVDRLAAAAEGDLSQSLAGLVFDATVTGGVPPSYGVRVRMLKTANHVVYVNPETNRVYVFTGSSWSSYIPPAGLSLSSANAWYVPDPAANPALVRIGVYGEVYNFNPATGAWSTEGFLSGHSVQNVFPSLDDEKVLYLATLNSDGSKKFLKSGDGGSSLQNCTVPSEVLPDDTKLVWSNGATFSLDGRYVTFDGCATAWRTTGISLPVGWQIGQAARSGSRWLVTMVRPSNYALPRTYMSATGASNSFTEIFFPSYQDVFPARNVTLPAGINYPLGVFKFTPQ